MTPKSVISMLDRKLAKYGQPVHLRRGGGPQHQMRGFVRGYKPEQLVGLVSQADRQVVLSPSGLGQYGRPKAEDHIQIDERMGVVKDVEAFLVDDVLVRLNLRVTMA